MYDESATSTELALDTVRHTPTPFEEALSRTQTYKQCHHIFDHGHRCGSPTLRGHEFCYYHHHVRYPKAEINPSLGVPTRFGMPSPETLLTPAGVQLALGEALHAIATDQVLPKTGALLLQGLQIASNNLSRLP